MNELLLVLDVFIKTAVTLFSLFTCALLLYLLCVSY